MAVLILIGNNFVFFSAYDRVTLSKAFIQLLFYQIHSILTIVYFKFYRRRAAVLASFPRQLAIQSTPALYNFQALPPYYYTTYNHLIFPWLAIACAQQRTTNNEQRAIVNNALRRNIICTNWKLPNISSWRPFLYRTFFFFSFCWFGKARFSHQHPEPFPTYIISDPKLLSPLIHTRTLGTSLTHTTHTLVFANLRQISTIEILQWTPLAVLAEEAGRVLLFQVPFPLLHHLITHPSSLCNNLHPQHLLFLSLQRPRALPLLEKSEFALATSTVPALCQKIPPAKEDAP